MKRILYVPTQKNLLNILGEQDKNIKILEKTHKVQIYYYPIPTGEGFEVEIIGNKDGVEKTFLELQNMSTSTNKMKVEMMHTGYFKKNVSLKKYEYLTFTGEIIKPKTATQLLYMENIDNYDIVIAIGPAGTGKTFLAVMSALLKFEQGEVSKIVLTRPVVEAGEKLGYLPGDLYDKINPYLKPLYDAFFILLGQDKLRRYLDEEIIEIIPLAYMRGRTLNDAFIILDEAQNTVPEQMKMFLTRLGTNSKLVIAGDITQVDIDNKQNSGLVQISKILKNLDEIKFIFFNEHDIIRHKLVKKIIKAYEMWEKISD